MQRIALVLIAGTFLFGCSYKAAVVPSADLTFAAADYTVLGQTNHEECGTYIFAIDWAHLGTDQSAKVPAASLLASIFGGVTPEEGRALYHALDKMPEATHLMANRSHVTTNGWVMFGIPIFGKRCAAVTAHGVKVGNKPHQLLVPSQ